MSKSRISKRKSQTDKQPGHKRYGYRGFFNGRDYRAVLELVDAYILYQVQLRYFYSSLPEYPFKIGWRDFQLYFNWKGGWREVNYTSVRNLMVKKLNDKIPLTSFDEGVLRPYGTGSIPEARLLVLDNDYSIKATDLWQRWKWIEEAKMRLNAAKSAELIIFADLLAEYPEKLMVKKLLDPSQGGARPNIKHIEDRFRLRARKILNNRKLYVQDHQFHRCSHSLDYLPLVPYDRILQFLINTLVQ